MNNQTSGPQEGRRKTTFLMKCGQSFYDRCGLTFENIDWLEYFQCALMDFCVSTSSTFVTDIWANWWLSLTDMRDNQILVRIQICSNFSRKKKNTDVRIVNNKILNILSLCHTLTWNFEEILKIWIVNASLRRSAFLLSLSTGPPILLTR